MGSSAVQSDIKILFYIVNSLIGLVPGFLTFCYGVAFGVNFGMQFGPFPLVLILAGVIVLGATALGYFGAIKDHRITLYIYSGLLALAALGDLVTYVVMQPTNPRRDPTLLATPLVHLGLSLLALGLAVTLARQARQHVNFE
ncbi:uncharacterized protein LOC125235266 [Leguminivora glycinivorella]|uniref:uncharacterized protein LOC125235266 n=1 Tax=Leguminivora glycinivorella TaxID=1035111 RepID=UPI00200F8677|nr:uncharacterized protein LOC125235266 [Leguminivora glycinivorella]